MFVCRSVRKCMDSVEYEQTVLFLLLTGLRTIKLCCCRLLTTYRRAVIGMLTRIAQCW